MSIAFHPSETTLLDYSGATLSAGARLVVTAHLEGCAACRADVASLEAAAGVMLASLEPVEMDEHALSLALARIERPAPPAPPAPAPLATALLSGVEVPAALRRADIGRTRWMAPGIRVAKIRGAEAGEKLYLLRASAGTRLPHHGHHGDEFTYVLKGAFSDDGGHYAVGDMVEAGGDDIHTPMVDTTGDCVCLIFANGKMQMREWLPRILQPFFGV